MRRLAAAFAASILMLCSVHAIAEENVIGNAGLVVPHADMPALRDEALAGSPDAALRLYRHYKAIAVDSEQARHWARIAAENGSPIGQYSFAFELLERKAPDDGVRARFWLRRAAEQGNTRAREVLNALEHGHDIH
jgi:TPR repeat protein